MVQIEMSAPVFDPDSGGGDEILYLYDAATIVGGVRGFSAVGEAEVAQFHDLGYTPSQRFRYTYG